MCREQGLGLNVRSALCLQHDEIQQASVWLRANNASTHARMNIRVHICGRALNIDLHTWNHYAHTRGAYMNAHTHNARAPRSALPHHTQRVLAPTHWHTHARRSARGHTHTHTHTRTHTRAHSHTHKSFISACTFYACNKTCLHGTACNYDNAQQQSLLLQFTQEIPDCVLSQNSGTEKYLST